MADQSLPLCPALREFDIEMRVALEEQEPGIAFGEWNVLEVDPSAKKLEKWRMWCTEHHFGLMQKQKHVNGINDPGTSFIT